MSSNYWSKVNNQRLTRRRALAITGAGAFSAAFLAACGGDDDEPSPSSTGGSTGSTGSTGSSGSTGATGSTGASTGASNSLIFQPVSTTAQAKTGGIMKHYAPADITHFDALIANSASTVNYGSTFAYNRLLKFTAGEYPNVADGSQEAEMAESWEVSPDKLTVTMKIRQGPGTKWDERAPTNGREMTMDDVLFSYNKFAELNPSGANVANSRNPSAPVISVEATDDKTLVIKLAKPDATILPLFAATDHLYLMPTEADGGFDPAKETRGNGEFFLEEYQPSSKYVWAKNPNYYVSGRPFFDKIERPIVTELAQQLAQFRAGNIMTDLVSNAQQEVIQLKKDVGDKGNLWLPNTYPNTLTPSVWYGYEGDSPFKDARVRQAFSMLVDRDAFNSAIYNADVFEDAGLGVEPKFNTCITAGWGPYWLDPKGSDFGPNAKYLQYNEEEAMSLLNAAGFPNGVDTEMFFNQEGTYGPSYGQAAEVFAGMFSAPGGTIKQSGFTYAEYLNTYYFGYRSGASTRGSGEEAKGFNGFAVEAERPYATAVNLMLGSWHSSGGAFHGMTPDGNDAFSGDPKVDSLIETIQSEFDQEKQVALTHDLIRYMTEMSYMIPRPVVTPGYQIWSAAVMNVGMRERWPNNAIWSEEAIDYWIDSSKL